MRVLTFLGLFVALATLSVQNVEAARIYLDPEESVHSQLDTFYVPIRVDTQGECINAVSVALAYDPTVLSVHDVFIGDSILLLWTHAPEVVRVNGRETGRVLFEGGIQGGYCGRLDGDPGLTNILAKLVVSGVPLAQSTSTVAVAHIIVEPDTAVYLHDGVGGMAPLTVLGVDLTLLQSTSTPRNEWLADIKSDIISPEYFEITLVEGPSAGHGRHYIVFSTTDKQSGVDHFEVLETDPDRFGFLTWVPREAYWVEAKSPYVLRDQKLRSKILVRAVDKNGNVRTSEYTPPMSPLVQLTLPGIFVPILLLVFLLGLTTYFVVRRHRRLVRVEREVDTPQNEE